MRRAAKPGKLRKTQNKGGRAVKQEEKIPLFSRRELTISFDLQRVREICTLLAGQGVTCAVRRTGHKPDARLTGESTAGRQGPLFDGGRMGYEYILYVHRKDLERAQELLKRYF